MSDEFDTKEEELKEEKTGENLAWEEEEKGLPAEGSIAGDKLEETSEDEDNEEGETEGTKEKESSENEEDEEETEK